MTERERKIAIDLIEKINSCCMESLSVCERPKVHVDYGGDILDDAAPHIVAALLKYGQEIRLEERKECADIVSAAAGGYEMTARIAGSVHFPGKPPTNAELLACCAGALKNAAHEIRSRSEE